MPTDLSTASIKNRFDHLIEIMSSSRFLNKEGLGNEVPFFICQYKPEENKAMLDLADQLARNLDKKGIHVLIVNLYDLSIDILKERGIWDQIIETEPSISKDELKELLQSVLDPEQHLVPAIRKKMEHTNFDILFITGVGEVFPYIRSHTVLNNLQSTAKEKPTVMFFPGEYRQSSLEGSSLSLFGRLLDDNYYRAFDIYKNF